MCARVCITTKSQIWLIHLALKSELIKVRKAIQAVSEASVPVCTANAPRDVCNYVCMCIIMYVNRINKTKGKWGN